MEDDRKDRRGCTDRPLRCVGKCNRRRGTVIVPENKVVTPVKLMLSGGELLALGFEEVLHQLAALFF